MPGISIYGENVDNLRYADDMYSLLMKRKGADNTEQITRVQECSMEINVKKMKVLVISKKEEVKCGITVIEAQWDQVTVQIP